MRLDSTETTVAAWIRIARTSTRSFTNLN